jgi:hypothetical protein
VSTPSPSSEPEADFWRLFDRHWNAGTGIERFLRHRPSSWYPKLFASALDDAGAVTDYSTVNKWVRHANLPGHERLDAILAVFFAAPDHPDAAAIRQAWIRATTSRSRRAVPTTARPPGPAALPSFSDVAATISNAPVDPIARGWVPQDTRFTLASTNEPSDASASLDPFVADLHAEISEKAVALCEAAHRLANTPGWSRLPSVAERFRAAITCDALELPKQLASLYSAMLTLATLFEQHQALTTDSFQDPLPPDIVQPLSDLIRTGAPWLRRFPSVRRQDDESGAFLTRRELFEPARAVLKAAIAEALIDDVDAAEVEQLLDVGSNPGPIADKAANRGVATVGALVRTGALAMATFFSGAVASDYANRSILVQATGRMLHAVESAALSLVPPDLGSALRDLLRHGRTDDLQGPVSASFIGIASSNAAQPPPDFSMEEVQRRLLANEPVPHSWIPFVHDLDLAGTEIVDLSRISTLTHLQRLSLWDTYVFDISPLSAVPGLRSLNLRNTAVADLTPLTVLPNLQSLILSGIRVTNLNTLCGLTNEQAFFLLRTASIQGRLPKLEGSFRRSTGRAATNNLENLTELNISDTSISDLSPLLTLPSLSILDISRTKVETLSYLWGVKGLKKLILTGLPEGIETTLLRRAEIEIIRRR